MISRSLWSPVVGRPDPPAGAGPLGRARPPDSACINPANSGDLFEVLRRYRAGEQVVVHFYRDGSEIETDVTLGARPN